MNIFKKALNRFLNRKKTKMEQEILEQPDIVFDLIRKYINKDYTVNIELPENINRVILAASGSSYHSARMAADFIRKCAQIDAYAYYASEADAGNCFNIDNETLYVFISQSGETADTNNVFDKVLKITDKTFAVVNAKNSRLKRSSKYGMLTYAGDEKAAAATKTMCAQLFCLFLLALKLAETKGISSIKYIDELLTVPDYIKNTLSRLREPVKKCAEILADYEHAAVLASGMFYPLAKEGALKIKEVSYINISAYPAGEFLHGHIALLNKKCAVIMIVTEDNLQYSIDVLMKINKSFKADVLIISQLPVNSAEAEGFIHIPAQSSIDFMFSSLTALQLLAFETAVLLNRNPDAPEGLTKVVK